MKNRLISFLSIFLLSSTIVLSSCGSGDNPSGEDKPSGGGEVTPEPGPTTIAVTSVSITPKDTYSIVEGSSVQFIKTVAPNDASDKTVTWSSTDTSVGTIDSNGLFIANKAGNTTVKCVSNSDNSKFGLCDITVTPKPEPLVIPVTSISISKYEPASPYVGDSVLFTASVLPSDASDKTIIWSIEEETSDAIINQNAIFSASKAGTYHVIATSKTNPDVKDRKEITVREKEKEPVHVTSVSISYTSTSLKINEQIPFIVNVLPINADNKVVSWSIEETDGASISSSGVFTATKAGTYHVIASSVDVPSITDRKEIIISGEEVEPTITLSTPILSIDNTSGKVTWNKIDKAESYKYYINAGEIKETTNNYLFISDGEAISVMADSSKDNVIGSNWSKPISLVNIDETHAYATIYFRDAPNLKSVYVKKGVSYTAPTNPVKGDYIFLGWYVDAFFNEKYVDGSVIEKDTILFAKWQDPNYINGAIYYLKCDEKMSDPYGKKSKINSWGTIPLHLDNEECVSHNNKQVYSAVVNVKGASVNNPSHYLVMDGFDDNNGTDHFGRTYWKNVNDTDFLINSDGTYKIRFSVEYSWNDGGSGVHCSAKQYSVNQTLSLSRNGLYSVAMNADILDTPVVNIDKKSNIASWESIEDAIRYEYSIDNGNILSTTSNYVSLYQGQSVVVRAISDTNYLSSKWSIPTSYPYNHYEQGNYVYIYFYDIDRPSFKITRGETITKGDNPTKAGYTFNGYYSDITYKTLFDFSKPINKNAVIYAKWDLITDSSNYVLINSSNTVIGTFIPNLSQSSFNEYKCSFTSTSKNQVVKIVNKNNHSVIYDTITLNDVAPYRIYFSNEHFYDRDKKTFSYMEYDTYKWYLTKNDKISGWDRICFYAYKNIAGGVIENAKWPGEEMTYDYTNDLNQAVFVCRVRKDFTYLVFNNGGKDGGYSQSVDIALPNNQDQYNAFWLGDKNNDGKRVVAGTWKR